MIISQDEAINLLKERFNMLETQDRAGMRYLRFGQGTQWVVSTGMNQYLLNVRENYAWNWVSDLDKNGQVKSYDLIWENTTFKMELCDDNSLIYKVGQLHLKWLELEKEIKEKKYQMKLNRINEDFQMTEAEVEECKKYVTEQGFIVYDDRDFYGQPIEVIFMGNERKLFNIIARFGKDWSALHNIRFYNNKLNCTARADEVQTVDEFKTLLTNRIVRWKVLKEKLKLNKLNEDF